MASSDETAVAAATGRLRDLAANLGHRGFSARMLATNDELLLWVQHRSISRLSDTVYAAPAEDGSWWLVMGRPARADQRRRRGSRQDRLRAHPGMTGSTDIQAINVIPLQTAARAVWETSSELRSSYPGWHIWYSTWSASWNAYRKGQEPYFGPVPDGAPVFMVSASSVPQLVALLEWQTLGDLRREFPGWQIGRTDSGCWYAMTRGQRSVRLIQGLAAAPFGETMRALTRRQRCGVVGPH